LKTNTEIDFEGQSTYSILIQSDDGKGGQISQHFTISVNDVIETNINELDNNISFKVYPNPAIDKLTIEFENPENKKLLLELKSYTGALVYSEYIIQEKTINISEYSSGLYFVNITGENIEWVWKIIIEK
jgi:hypothetical protein